jgi:RNA polymerase sigma-70 factor (ECF subfamily)
MLRVVGRNGRARARAGSVAPRPDEVSTLQASAPRSSTERDLVLAFQRGQAEAYSEIYLRYQPMVSHICRRLLKSPDDADEAAQETMLRVLQGLGRFNGRYLLQAWVARIATNVCLDQLRAKTRRHGDPEQLPEDYHLSTERSEQIAPEDPGELVERLVDREQVRHVLEELPSHHRSALVLREFQGMSHEEIAGQLGMTPPQAKALIHRAKKSFRQAWASAGNGRGLGLLLPSLLPRVRMPRFIRRLWFGFAESASQAAASPTVTAAANMGTERVAAAAIAVAVVAGAAGYSVAHKHEAPPPQRTRIVTTTAEPATEGLAPSLGPAVRVHAKPHKSRSKAKPSPSVVTATLPSPEPTLEAPVIVPTPEPSPTDSPAPEPSPSDTPSPEPSPTMVPEPQGFDLWFGVDLAAGSGPCSCLKPTRVVSEGISVTEEDGVRYLDQVLEGTADAAGTPSYGMWLHQSSSTGTEQALDVRLFNDEGSYQYTASGTLTERLATEWGGWVYRYEGTYQIYSTPKAEVTMPSKGTYVMEVAASWRQARVVSVTISFMETS